MNIDTEDTNVSRETIQEDIKPSETRDESGNKPDLIIDLDNLVFDPAVAPKKAKPGSSGKMNFISKEMRVAMYKDLTFMTALEVSKKYGIDKLYPTPGSQYICVYTIAKAISKAPDLFGVSQDVVDIVSESLKLRNPTNKTLGEKKSVELREKDELKDKVQLIAEKTAEALNKKLDKALKTAKDLEDIPLRELASLLGTAIDKSRLLKGESTEHVMHYAKLDTDSVTPEQAMELILRAREAMIESKRQ